MRKEPLEVCVLDEQAFTKNEEKWGEILSLTGRVIPLWDDTGQQWIVPCVVQVVASGTGTLEVEIHGSVDGANWTEDVQIVAAKASDGAHAFYHPELKYYPFVRFKFLENDVNPLTTATCWVAFA